MKNSLLTETQVAETWAMRSIKPAVLMVLTTLTFAYGVGVGHYQWPPFWQIQGAKNTLTQLLPEPVVESVPEPVVESVPEPVVEYFGEAELLVYAFTDPVGEADLYYPPITDLEGIRRANDRIFMLRQGFETAFEDLQVLKAEQVNRPQGAVPVVRVRFEYQDREHEAFAYGRLPAVCDGNNPASLIIPGSGLNQSLGIATGDKANYHHGILDALNGGGGEIFTLIKPNEDFLAWHDGSGRKLSGDFIWNWHLNREGSYSVSYLMQSLAFVKYLQGCFAKVVLAGLSQGGTAALLNAIQSKPDYVIVASGYTVEPIIEFSRGNSIVNVPGYANILNKKIFGEVLAKSPSRWFFSWGLEDDAVYASEFNERSSETVLKGMENSVTCYHSGGHSFPVLPIVTFLSSQAAYYSCLGN